MNFKERLRRALQNETVVDDPYKDTILKQKLEQFDRYGNPYAIKNRADGGRSSLLTGGQILHLLDGSIIGPGNPQYEPGMQLGSITSPPTERNYVYDKGGYIKNEGGGDAVVYGARHSQGGVMRDSNTELEGGGYTASGNAKPGEVITTIYDAGGKPQEFFMSHKNGIAQQYLADKAAHGGVLPQKRKQMYAVMNERANPQGHPEDIAANGGVKKYNFGGNVRRTRLGRLKGASNPTDPRYGGGLPTMGQGGGMKKYFMGGTGTPMEGNKFKSAVSRKSGYTLEDGGRKKYFGGGSAGSLNSRLKGQQARYFDAARRRKSGYAMEHGGPHKSDETLYYTTQDGRKIPIPQDNAVLKQGRPPQGKWSKAWEALVNPVQAFAQYNKYGELPDHFSENEDAWEGKSVDFVLDFINPFGYIQLASDVGKAIDDEGFTKENMAMITLLAATKGKVKGNTAKVNKALKNLNDKVNKTIVGRGFNPFHGWKGMGSQTTKKVVTPGKLKGKPGSYTRGPGTPMIETVDRTVLERAKNLGSNVLNVGKKGTIYGTTYGVGNWIFGDDEESTRVTPEFSFTPGDESIEYLTGTRTNYVETDPQTTDTVELGNITTTEDEAITRDSIDYIPIGGTWTNSNGVTYRRISPANDASGYEIVTE